MAVAPERLWQGNIGRAVAGEAQMHSVLPPVSRPLKRTHNMFLADYAKPTLWDEESHRVSKAPKLHPQYRPALHMPTLQENLRESRGPSSVWDPYGHKQPSGRQGQGAEYEVSAGGPCPPGPGVPRAAYADVWRMPSESAAPSSAAAPPAPQHMDANWRAPGVGGLYRHAGISQHSQPSVAVGEAGGYRIPPLIPRRAPTMPKPQWHPPWKLHRVIRVHLKSVRCIAVEPGNRWFVTGSDDRTIKIWDLASGILKLSFKGHNSVVRGVAVSARSPYVFSCGGYGEVQCWDLEYNKIIRHYRGHVTTVYGLDLRPTTDVLVTCGRDTTVRVWDPRTEASVQTLSGHTSAVATVKCQAEEPQIITGSHDTTVRLWDLVAARARVTLTDHQKSARAVVLHPRYYTFASAAPDQIKQWKLPYGDFIQDLSGHKALINALAVNSDGVLASGGADGSVHLWDWRSGYNFQRIQAPVQQGPSAIFACAFDQTGTTLLTAESDKTIKVYKEDHTATEATHPFSCEPKAGKKTDFSAARY
ncbi:pleiotropic regulator 1-like [Prinia subflava]|uniref:pleiotropic regulator 1-like n=1 Tax=Prinia subflava TaxID=208062 RepID=UPI002FE04CBA